MKSDTHIVQNIQLKVIDALNNLGSIISVVGKSTVEIMEPFLV